MEDENEVIGGNIHKNKNMNIGFISGDLYRILKDEIIPTGRLIKFSIKSAYRDSYVNYVNLVSFGTIANEIANMDIGETIICQYRVNSNTKKRVNDTVDNIYKNELFAVSLSKVLV